MTKSFRFAVGEPGKACSAKWSIWSHKSNVYIVNAAIGGQVKLSLHGDDGSDVCHMALPTEYFAAEKAAGLTLSDRTLFRWHRAPTPATGGVYVLSLQFPCDHIKGEPHIENSKKPIHLLRPAGNGMAIEVGIFYSWTPFDEAHAMFEGEGRLLWGMRLERGDYVYIADRAAPFTIPKMPNGEELDLEQPFSLSMRSLSARRLMAVGEEWPDCSFLLHTEPKDGETLQLIEFSGAHAKRDS